MAPGKLRKLVSFVSSIFTTNLAVVGNMSLLSPNQRSIQIKCIVITIINFRYTSWYGFFYSCHYVYQYVTNKYKNKIVIAFIVLIQSLRFSTLFSHKILLNYKFFYYKGHYEIQLSAVLVLRRRVLNIKKKVLFI